MKYSRLFITFALFASLLASCSKHSPTPPQNERQAEEAHRRVEDDRRRIEDQTALAAGIADQRQAAIEMLGSFRMKGDDIGPGLGKIGDDAVNRLDHQVYVDRRLGAGPDGFAN